MPYQNDNERFQSGQPGGELFEHYAASIFAYARLHLRTFEDAEDLLLEVFMAAWEQGNLSWLTDSQQLVWLRRVAHNKLVDRYRRSHHGEVLSFDYMLETLRSPEALLPEQVVVRREELAELSSLLGTLSLFQTAGASATCWGWLALCRDRRVAQQTGSQRAQSVLAHAGTAADQLPAAG